MYVWVLILAKSHFTVGGFYNETTKHWQKREHLTEDGVAVSWKISPNLQIRRCRLTWSWITLFHGHSFVARLFYVLDTFSPFRLACPNYLSLDLQLTCLASENNWNEGKKVMKKMSMAWRCVFIRHWNLLFGLSQHQPHVWSYVRAHQSVGPPASRPPVCLSSLPPVFSGKADGCFPCVYRAGSEVDWTAGPSV